MAGAVDVGKKEMLESLGVKVPGKGGNPLESALKILDHRSVQKPLDRLVERFLPEKKPETQQEPKPQGRPESVEPTPGIPLKPGEAAQHTGKRGLSPWQGTPIVSKPTPAPEPEPAPASAAKTEEESINEAEDVIDSLLLFLALQPKEMTLEDFIVWVTENRQMLVNTITRGKKIGKRLGV